MAHVFPSSGAGHLSSLAVENSPTDFYSAFFKCHIFSSEVLYFLAAIYGLIRKNDSNKWTSARVELDILWVMFTAWLWHTVKVISAVSLSSKLTHTQTTQGQWTRADCGNQITALHYKITPGMCFILGFIIYKRVHLRCNFQFKVYGWLA